MRYTADCADFSLSPSEGERAGVRGRSLSLIPRPALNRKAFAGPLSSFPSSTASAAEDGGEGQPPPRNLNRNLNPNRSPHASRITHHSTIPPFHHSIIPPFHHSHHSITPTLQNA